MKLNTKKVLQAAMQAAFDELLTQIIFSVALRRPSYEDRKIAVKKAWEIAGYDH